ncbi:MMPL family transporter [Couchioplanes caeruleus]|uniref:MMPL family transporter n=2 Tax=Couchioplanes caeruleus TaxID=56438 RepID=UPI001B87CFD5|nr:MMPL family transporter [Couchioplanes caeruleus]
MARFRWAVLVCTVAAVAAAGAWGTGVFDKLSEGGYTDPGSESSRATEVAAAELGMQSGDVVVIYRPAKGTIDDAALGHGIEKRLDALPESAVTAVTGYWPGKVAQYAAADRKSAVAVLTLAGADDGEKLAAYREIDDKLTVPDATVQLAGGIPLADASGTRSTRDLAFAEAISLPVVLILLLFIFGSLVAASLPVLVGGCAVLGSLGVLHAIASGHDVNPFAVNVASLLGLGMAIDYGLFMVGRFREEQSSGRTPAQAVTRTVATAGRTVLFSACLLMIALSGLLFFPQGFLKSLAYGGLAAVALAALLSLTLLPALLAVLGHRVDKLPVRLPRRRGGRPEGTGWAALAGFVLRRPVLVALPILAGLAVLAAPIHGVQFGENDERVLPAADPARRAIETLKTDFPVLSSAGIQIVLHGTGEAPKDAPAFADKVAKIPGVAAVTPTGAGGKAVTYTATLTATDPFGPQARTAVERIRDLPPPAGARVLVGGTTARSVDSLSATADRLPQMIGLLVGATLLLMFLAFGSILLPVKAVLMSAVSLGSTFGILVWIFQDGHGADLLRITPAPLEVGIVILMAAVVFGLSTDYEVFLLSRMVEARTRGASTAEAVTTGLARTGRVISAAAVLLIVVTGAFALSSVTTMRFIGIGMIVALFLDATVVRMLLVPAVLRLLGDAAWWAPGPLRRLQERAGLAEYEDELYPTVSAGRHAARALPPASPSHAEDLPSPAVLGSAMPEVAAMVTPRLPSLSPSPSSPSSPSPSPSPAAPALGGGWVFGAVVPGLPTAGSAPVPMPERVTLEEQVPGLPSPATAPSPAAAPSPATTPSPAAAPFPAAAWFPAAASFPAAAPLPAARPENFAAVPLPRRPVPPGDLPRRPVPPVAPPAAPVSPPAVPVSRPAVPVSSPAAPVSPPAGPAFFGPVRATAPVPRTPPDRPLVSPAPAAAPPPAPPATRPADAEFAPDPLVRGRRPRDLSELAPVADLPSRRGPAS